MPSDQVHRPTSDRLRSRFLSSVQGRLFTGVGAVVCCTLVAVTVAVTGYATFGVTLQSITGQSVPSALSAMRVAQHASQLDTLAPSFAAIATAEERGELAGRIAAERGKFETELSRLDRQEAISGDAVAPIRAAGATLLSNITQLDAAAGRRIELAARRDALLAAANDGLGRIAGLLAPWKSMHGSETESLRRTVLSDDGAAPARLDAALSYFGVQEKLLAVRGLDDAVGTVRGLLAGAAGTPEDQGLMLVESKLGGQLALMGAAAERLPEKLRDAMRPALAGVQGATLGPDGLVATRAAELGLLKEQGRLVADNLAASQRLMEMVGTLVDAQQDSIARSTRDTERVLANGTRVQVAVGLVSAVLSVLVILIFVRRMVVRRLLALQDAMVRIADGDLSVPVATDGRDEITAMARTVQVFRENALEKRRLEAEQVELAHRAAAERHRALDEMAAAFEGSVGGVVRRFVADATEMKASASAMFDSAAETDRLATAVSTVTQETSASVETVAAAAEQLSGSIEEITRQITDSTAVADEAMRLAQGANAQIAGLAETVEDIGRVVELINEIASQTNLLALNATIEAARAGEAGKGFAVVASEVKALANQTAKATGDIAAQAATIQSATGDAVHKIQAVVQVVTRVGTIGASIAAAADEQSAATREIARSVQQASVGTADVSTNIGGVRSAADSSGTAARTLLAKANALADGANGLSREVSDFLARVREN